MKNENLVSRLEDLIVESQKLVEELKQVPTNDSLERVKKGESFYHISMKSDTVDCDQVIDQRCVIDDNYYRSNNYFLTRERAEQVVEKIRYLLKLERVHDILCPNYEPDWSDPRPKVAVCFDHLRNRFIPILDVFSTDVEQKTATYFTDITVARKACKLLNDEVKI